MQTSPETLRAALLQLDACAHAYADACVAYAQTEASATWRATTQHLLVTHDALKRAAREVASLE